MVTRKLKKEVSSKKVIGSTKKETYLYEISVRNNRTTPITIGRAADSTIVLDDDFVSTNHARLTPQGKTWVIEDLGSTNGTWIGRSRVTKPTVLSPRSTLRIGRTSMELSS
jgi:pSer/pThr/pTyr-binding forkhead associated (FHA) protein